MTPPETTCHHCGKSCEPVAGNPDQWPVRLGNDRVFHVGCVNKLLALRTAEAAELDLLREFCDRVTEYRLSYLDAKGEKSADMEKRLIGGRGPARNTTDAARRAAGVEQ